MTWHEPVSGCSVSSRASAGPNSPAFTSACSAVEAGRLAPNASCSRSCARRAPSRGASRARARSLTGYPP